jgi:hypothetical protein
MMEGPGGGWHRPGVWPNYATLVGARRLVRNGATGHWHGCPLTHQRSGERHVDSGPKAGERRC